VETLPIVALPGDDAALEQLLMAHGLVLTAAETRRVGRLLGRDPTLVELHIFNTMWSEHCSYKSSRAILKEFLPTSGPRVVLGPVEDAGIVRVADHDGKSWCVVVGHESHNHPSQVVPYEGAATGVGGILRDIYCMGAEVFGVLDSLRFGDPEGPNAARVREIVRGVVDGISGYANPVGVPNLGGEALFSSAFDDNCLVNVVALGLVEESRVVRSRVPAAAAVEEYVLLLFGKPTDDSGFGGAAFASVDLDEEDVDANRGAVQAPDPFLKRVLAVALREVLDHLDDAGVAFGLKDLGAGGIACVTSELAHAGGFGAEIDLDAVPVSLPDLPAEVIACAETQERFCLALPRGAVEDVLRIFNQRFELPRVSEGAEARVIGRVLRERRFVLRHQGHAVCDAAVEAITEGIRHDRPRRPRVVAAAGPAAGPRRAALDAGAAVERLLGSIDGASRRAIFRHYDTEVQGHAVIRPGEADAALSAPVPGAPFGIAVACDGDPWIGHLDPWAAGATAVEEAVRNVAAVGGRALCITDCLNYGSPEVPEVMHDFREGVRGIADACRALGMVDDDADVDTTPIPVVSGNVSFYNQSAGGGAVAPSPVVACVGWVPNLARAVTLDLKAPGSYLVLVGERRAELGGSALARLYPELEAGGPRPVELERSADQIRATLDAIDRGLVLAAHDVSAGGIAQAAAEMLFAGRQAEPKLGMRLDLDAMSDDAGVDVAGRLFGETPGFLLEVNAASLEPVLAAYRRYGVWVRLVGAVRASAAFSVTWQGRDLLRLDAAELSRRWQSGLTRVLA
jgi:phosphoribosylformylglycinamidine synthase